MRVPHGNFSQVRIIRQFPHCNRVRDPSLKRAVCFPLQEFLDVARRRGNHGEGYSSYVPGGAYKLRQFTEPISRHVTSTVQ